MPLLHPAISKVLSILDSFVYSRHCFSKEIKAFRTKTYTNKHRKKNETFTHRHFFVFILKPKLLTISRFSREVTAAMLVYRTIAKNVFWEFESIIMQNLSDIFRCFVHRHGRSITWILKICKSGIFVRQRFLPLFFKEPFPQFIYAELAILKFLRSLFLYISFKLGCKERCSITQ